MNFAQIQQQEHDSMMPTYGRFAAALCEGRGALVKDVEGKEYVDFTSGIGVNSLGYCDEGWVKAVSAQAGKLQHISNLYYSPVQTELAARLCALTGFGKVFLCNSGAEANECAIKLARKYSVEKYGKERTTIVSLLNSFHGRTVTTLAATGQDSFHNYFFPFTEGFRYAKADDMASVQECVDEHTCAVLIELVQGEGGVMPLSRAFVTQLADFCKQRDILLLVDEVQTGVGRTGSLYCYEQYGIHPDVITSAKGLGGGLPVGACLCTEELGGVMGPGMHGTTFGGNPVVCAGALEVLSRVADEGFLQQVREKGGYLRRKLEAMPNVAQVRGMGMMLGVAPQKGTSKELAAACVQQGLLLLTAKEMLRLLPPLTISYEEIDRGLAILQQVMAGRDQQD
ncbi:MAG TPA: aspartate aminotransferase family protein [Candidatus Gallacutalibacter stercoravium]|nr:aspartate aminotransferase family protein [Candidatus Gallacutalibacter stercoravium]